MFAALSYNFGGLQNKLNYFGALAPIVNLKNSPNSLFSTLGSQWWFIYGTLKNLHLWELRDPKLSKEMVTFCNKYSSVCNGIEGFFHLNDNKWNDKERTDVMNARVGSGASIKQAIHYAQISKTGVFKQFDYGTDKDNIAHYGSKIVPLITIDKIKSVPIGMFVGKEDDLGYPTDERVVKQHLKTLSFYKEYAGDDHMSFSLGKDMSFSADLMKELDKHNNRL